MKPTPFRSLSLGYLAVIPALLCVALLLPASYVFAAWSSPTGIPPSGNVAAPLNTSPANQTKFGSLTVAGDFLSVSTGNLFLPGAAKGIFWFASANLAQPHINYSTSVLYLSAGDAGNRLELQGDVKIANASSNVGSLLLENPDPVNGRSLMLGVESATLGTDIKSLRKPLYLNYDDNAGGQGQDVHIGKAGSATKICLNDDAGGPGCISAWPSGPGGTYSAANGLTLIGSAFEFGGALSHATGLTFNSNTLTFNLAGNSAFNMSLAGTSSYLAMVSSSTNYVINLTGSGDFAVQDGGADRLVVKDNGAVALPGIVAPCSGTNALATNASGEIFCDTDDGGGGPVDSLWAGVVGSVIYPQTPTTTRLQIGWQGTGDLTQVSIKNSSLNAGIYAQQDNSSGQAGYFSGRVTVDNNEAAQSAAKEIFTVSAPVGKGMQFLDSTNNASTYLTQENSYFQIKNDAGPSGYGIKLVAGPANADALIVNNDKVSVRTLWTTRELNVAGSIALSDSLFKLNLATGGTTNFFTNSCNDPEESIKTINADGTMTCEADNGGSGGAGDNLGNHIADRTLQMSGNNIQLSNGWISNDGTNEGLRMNDGGKVGVGFTPVASSKKFTVDGGIASVGTAPEFCLGNSCISSWPTQSGTINQVAKFTGAASLGSSALTELGGALGINTTQPGLSITGGDAALDIYTDAGHPGGIRWEPNLLGDAWLGRIDLVRINASGAFDPANTKLSISMPDPATNNAIEVANFDTNGVFQGMYVGGDQAVFLRRRVAANGLELGTTANDNAAIITNNVTRLVVGNLGSVSINDTTTAISPLLSVGANSPFSNNDTIAGFNDSTSSNFNAISGKKSGSGAKGSGVYGELVNGMTCSGICAGLYGSAGDGGANKWAGYFDGPVNVGGNMYINGLVKPASVKVCEIGTNNCLGRYLNSEGTQANRTASGVKFYYWDEQASAMANTFAFDSWSSCPSGYNMVTADTTGITYYDSDYPLCDPNDWPASVSTPTSKPYAASPTQVCVRQTPTGLIMMKSKDTNGGCQPAHNTDYWYPITSQINHFFQRYELR